METAPISGIAGGIPGLMGAAIVKPSGKGKELEESCADFVGLLYSYVFSQMRATQAEEGEEGMFGGDNSQMFLGFLDQEIGNKMARSEGAGLAKQMLWQLNKAQGNSH